MKSSMRIELRERTEAHVCIYFDRTRDEEIQRLCPQRARTVEEAVRDFRETQKPDAGSFGRTIYADGEYVGDIWLYCIGEDDGPDAMLSFCLFEKAIWGKGIMTEAVRLFCLETEKRFDLRTVGAFAFMENEGCVRVLQKSGFVLKERVSEDGRESGYFERQTEDI